MPERAAVLIVHKNAILLVHRQKDGRDYHVVPGGTVEEGESPDQACVREIAEETGLSITLGRKLLVLENKGRTEHYFLAASFEGEVQLGGPEVDRQSESNRYDLVWLTASQLEGINLVPVEVRPLCRAALGEG